MKAILRGLLVALLAMPMAGCGGKPESGPLKTDSNIVGADDRGSFSDSIALSADIVINRTAYKDRLRGFWLGSCIANWTGLPTENVRAVPPFFSDDDWLKPFGRNGEVIDYVLDSDPWGADDDTDIEYVYQKALEKYGSYMLTGEQIATAWQDHTLAGWDSDNPTATWGGLLGLLYGYEGLQKHFGKSDFSDDYLISRTRYNFSMAPDNFTDMASGGLEVIDNVVVNGMGGGVVGGNWVIPRMHGDIVVAPVEETIVPWETIEDSDPRWAYKGFTTAKKIWNASGASLTAGQSECVAEITFSGTAVQYYSFRNAEAGTVTITLDDEDQSFVDLSNNVSNDGQYYVKVFERLGLSPGDHTLRITCDSDTTQKYIDMLSIIP